jgi:hypothetical protein
MSATRIPTIDNGLDDDSHKGCCLHADAHGQLVANDWGGLIILVVEDGGVKK